MNEITNVKVKKQPSELDMEQQTGSKSGKEYVKAVYCHPAYLTYMQSTLCEMPGCMKHKLESRLLGEKSITSGYWQMTPPLWQKERRAKEPLNESGRGEWKSWFKSQHSVGEGEGGMILENGIETCILSCKKQIASLGSIQDTGCLRLVHWDDPERCYGEGGERGVQDWELMYTCGRFMSMYGKPNTVL